MSFHKFTELSFEFTSHVRDQVTHGTCPIYPNHLKYRQNVIWPFGWHWKANVESRGKIYNVQELKHLLVSVREHEEIHSDTLIEFGVCVCQLRKQMTFRKSVLRTKVALEFTSRSDRDFVRSAIKATKQLFA